MRELLEQIVGEAEDSGLEFLLIGGNALAFYGYPRNTIDVDLLIPEDQLEVWEAFLGRLEYRKFHATDAFAQFEKPGSFPIDFMIVDAGTWEKLKARNRRFALGNGTVALPDPEHIVALKLHSAISPTRSRSAQDWEDIRQIVRIQKLDPEEIGFRRLILRYGGEESLERILSFRDD